MIKNLMSKLNNKPEGISGETSNASSPVGSGVQQVPTAPSIRSEISVPSVPPIPPSINDAINMPSVPTLQGQSAVIAPPAPGFGGMAPPAPPMQNNDAMQTMVPQSIIDNYEPVLDNNSFQGGNQMQVPNNQFSNQKAPISEGIIIDLGEGISLNVPIRKRMTITEFLKVAEKVKALEMLSEDNNN